MTWAIKKYTLVVTGLVFAFAHSGLAVDPEPAATEAPTAAATEAPTAAATEAAAEGATTTKPPTTASTASPTPGSSNPPVTLPPDWSVPQTFVRTYDSWRVLDQGDRAGEEAYNPELFAFAERDPLKVLDEFPGKWTVTKEQPPSGLHKCTNELRITAFKKGIDSVGKAVSDYGATAKDGIAFLPVFVAYPTTVPGEESKAFPVPAAPFTAENLFPKGSQSILCELFNPKHPGSASANYLSLGVAALVALAALVSF